MKKLILVFLIIFAGFIISCKEENLPHYPIDDNRVFIKVLDEQGVDLLDQTQAKSYKANVIKIFYEREGQLEEFYNGGLTNMRRNFRIDPPELDEKQHRMKLIIESEVKVIQWNELEADTLYSEIDYDEKYNKMSVRKVYHQGELKHSNIPALSRREFTIIKQRQ
ncbi:hypothetical protein [Algoriphagus hitonicola]|uniref:Uncharacterized protein n=1 Tax=Algoriphagus hitonicola TaxID=435880 RepID=A0A1I2WD41_9BACT|nr:hypothetical protein [Algoriphagus hitonicola]SFG98547.1 hypothetical protein SAMN04487988_11242 [Algoriphagus hitonicola]